MIETPTGRPAHGALLALAAAVFAAAFLIAFRVANRSAPHEAAVFGLLVAAMLFNGALALIRVRRLPQRPTRVTVLAVVVLAGFTILGNAGVGGALAHLDPGITSTVLQTQVFVVGIGGWWFLGERITPRLAVGMAFAFMGFVVLGLEDPSTATWNATGIGLALLAASSFGAMLVYTRKVIAQIDPFAVNAARLVVAVFVSGTYVLPSGVMREMTREAWIAVALAAFAGPFVSRLFLMHAVKHLSASRVQLIALTTPIYAFAFELLFFGTGPSTRELIGGALILLGVGLPSLAPRRAVRLPEGEALSASDPRSDPPR